MSDIATDHPAGTGEAENTGAWLQRFLALVLFVILLPVMALVALVVALFLGRPIFFTQRRAGLAGTAFPVLKFRSLKDLRDEAGLPLPDADRANAASHFLRRSRLDELPQLLCIMRGQMAFIGPRPLLPETIRSLGEPGRKRCTVRPGVTGWAQVCGNTRLDDTTKIALDIWYIDHRSVWLDARILVETLLTVIRGEEKLQRRIDMAMDHLRRAYGVPAENDRG